MGMCIFQFPIDPQIRHKWLEKWYPKVKLNKSARRICSIYFSMTAFIDNMKSPLSNQNINNLMVINFHISFLTKRFFRSFHGHREKTVTLRELLPNINKFRNKILDFFRKFHDGAWILNCSSYFDTRLESINFLQKSPPANSSQFFFFNGSQN